SLHDALPIYRHDGCAAFLSKKDDALAGLIDRSARSVGSDQDVAVRSESIDELAERDHTLARARAANRAVTRAFDEARDQIAVPAGADQPVTLAGGKTGIEHPRQHEQPIMPDGEDDGMIADKIDYPVWILDL